VRSESEILTLISELKQSIEYVRNNKDKWKDEEVPIEMIRKNIQNTHS
jgi:hypothetical protein